jgi:N6-adenosine-specific RNA methylase IME4
MDIIISDELRSLLPPLTSEEYRILEESIIVEGCRDPLLTWNNILIDGHNRYEICNRRGISFNVDEIEANSIEDIKVWIIDNQKGRRNLTDGWKFELAQVRKEIIAKQASENLKLSEGRGATGERKPLSIVDKPFNPINTQKEIAAELGWSTGKVAMADKVWKDATPEVKEAIKKGDVSINQAYKEIKREEKKEEKHFNISKMPDGEYRVIYADPPWNYNDKCSSGAIQDGGANIHYPTMTIKELCEMDLPKIANDAVLFLWTTSPILEDSFKVINAWGFKYKASFIWDKVKHNMGHYNSVRHEFLLIATKGSCTPDNLKLFDSVQSIEKTEHSEKPHEFYEIIETLYIGNKIELFARSKHKDWESWGNEI